MNRAPERLSLAVVVLLVPVSVAGSRRTTLRASLQDLEKHRQEPARALMAGDVLARLPEIDSYGSLNLGKPARGNPHERGVSRGLERKLATGPLRRLSAVTEAELGVSAVAGTW
jgi:hypothetical protein